MPPPAPVHLEALPEVRRRLLPAWHQQPTDSHCLRPPDIHQYGLCPGEGRGVFIKFQGPLRACRANGWRGGVRDNGGYIHPALALCNENGLRRPVRYSPGCGLCHLRRPVAAMVVDAKQPYLFWSIQLGGFFAFCFPD